MNQLPDTTLPAPAGHMTEEERQEATRAALRAHLRRVLADSHLSLLVALAILDASALSEPEWAAQARIEVDDARASIKRGAAVSDAPEEGCADGSQRANGATA